MRLIRVVTLSLALLLLMVSTGLAAPVVIKFSHSDGRDSLKGKASDYLKRLVEQRSNNRILVSINPDRPVVNQHILEALMSNSVQMAAPDIAELYSHAPQLRLFELPFLFSDTGHLHRVIDGDVGKRLLESASQSGLVALAFWDNGFRQLTANQPLLRPRQAEGLRIQVTESRVFKKQLERLGAEAQSIPQGQLYAALDKKKMDGQESTLATIYKQKLYQVQSNLTLSNHSYQGYLVVTNSQFWSQLPDDLKVIVRGAIRDATEYTRDMAAQVNAEALARINATASLRIDKLSQEEQKLWFEELKQIYPDPYRKVSEELIHKARDEQIK